MCKTRLSNAFARQGGTVCQLPNRCFCLSQTTLYCLEALRCETHHVTRSCEMPWQGVVLTSRQRSHMCGSFCAVCRASWRICIQSAHLQHEKIPAARLRVKGRVQKPQTHRKAAACLVSCCQQACTILAHICACCMRIARHGSHDPQTLTGWTRCSGCGSGSTSS